LFEEWKAIVLGIIQGLTEFLPISSTGHLYLGRHLFGLDEAGLLLDTMLHTGTLLALLVFYWHEIVKLLRNPFSKLTLLLLLGTIPAVLAGVLFNDYFESISKSGITIGWEFLITGLVLWYADIMPKQDKNLVNMTYKQALFIGSFQAAAIFPAISRSGFTMAAGLMSGLNRETSAYFSFLLSIPVIFGGILFKSKDLVTGPIEAISFQGLFLGTIFAALFGYLAVSWMIKYIKNHSLKPFAIYVILLGIVILILQYLNIF
jgi:undecaprenyl-diphosphatase